MGLKKKGICTIRTNQRTKKGNDNRDYFEEGKQYAKIKLQPIYEREKKFSSLNR